MRALKTHPATNSTYGPFLDGRIIADVFALCEDDTVRYVQAATLSGGVCEVPANSPTVDLSSLLVSHPFAGGAIRHFS